MGEFRKNLLEKINSRRAKEQKELTAGERLQKERQKLENALVFLEMTTSEAKEGWYIQSYRELTGHGLAGKLGIIRKKLQRKSLHWYLEPVCDDQSDYNQKLLHVLTALEDVVRVQANWSRELENQYETEVGALQAELSELKEELSGLQEELSQLKREEPALPKKKPAGSEASGKREILPTAEKTTTGGGVRS